MAIDGSTAVLPKHQSVIAKFGTTNFGPYADSPRSVARTSILYDVLNLTAIDAQIDTYDTSERVLAHKHFEFTNRNTDLILFDRGYPSLPMMFEMQQKGIHFLIRMRENWWTEVRQMIEKGETDKEVTFKLGAKDKKDLFKKYHTNNDKIKCRLVVIELADGKKEVLCTTVLDKNALSYKDFGELYHQRWAIEEGYKLLKCRIHLEAFSGKTALAVEQDFYAKIFMMTTAAVLAFPVSEKIRTESEHSTRKHSYKINRVNALSMTKEVLITIFIKKIIQPALDAFDKIIQKTTEIIRPNRTFPRKKIKKKPPNINYKNL